MTRSSRPLLPVTPVPRTARRRAAVGLAWTLGWTLAWGLAIFGYAHKPQAIRPILSAPKITR
jgi:hypothetical protein